MAVAILLIGVGAGFGLSLVIWAFTSSLLLAFLSYSVGGTLGCLVAGLGLALCRTRSTTPQTALARR
jgi:hypothetical protein